MNKKSNLSHPVQLYWQDIPSTGEEQTRNVLPAGTYTEPSKIINSSHVHVDAKPWLYKTKTKKKENKLPVKTKAALPKSMINNKENEAIAVKKANEAIAVKKANEGIAVNCSKEKMRANGSSCNESSQSACCLADLCKEDKQRIAELIREMAKFGEEKENATKELSEVKINFKSKLKCLEAEKQKMIKEQDALKERLLKYEILLAQVKQKNAEITLSNQTTIVEDFPRSSNIVMEFNQQALPEKMPGNLKSKKSSGGSVGNDKMNQKQPMQEQQQQQQQQQQQRQSLKPPTENLVPQLKDVDELTDIFFRQQDKFLQQQEILQRQIEQLQTLQESILHQQQQHAKEVQSNSTENRNQVQKNKTSHGNQVEATETHTALEENFFDDKTKGKHSLKLQKYISKQSNIDNNKPVQGVMTTECKQNVPEVSFNQVLVQDTVIEEDSRNRTGISITLNCLNHSTPPKINTNEKIKDNSKGEPLKINSTESGKDSATERLKINSTRKAKDNICVQDDVQPTEVNQASLKKTKVPLQSDVPLISKEKHVSKGKQDVCVGTDDESCHRNSAALNRLDLCKHNISKLEESLKYISSSQLADETNTRASILSNSKKAKVNINRESGIEIHKEVFDDILDDNDISDSGSDDEADDDLVRKSNSITSALQRQHFQPASILELIEGIEPPSTSTSIDHHSFKKADQSQTQRQVNRRTPLSPSNRLIKSKVKSERTSKLQRVYGSLKVRGNGGILKQGNHAPGRSAPGRSVEEQEEQRMLADVFFVR